MFRVPSGLAVKVVTQPLMIIVYTFSSSLMVPTSFWFKFFTSIKIGILLPLKVRFMGRLLMYDKLRCLLSLELTLSYHIYRHIQLVLYFTLLT